MHVGANQTIFRVVLQGEHITAGTKVLDVACAVGGNARWLASIYGCRVWGIDIDEAALQVATDLAEIEEVGQLCNFMKARVDKLPFEDGYFDLVMSTDIFDASEVRRVLKPGGRFVLSSLVEDVGASFETLAEKWGFEL